MGTEKNKGVGPPSPPQLPRGGTVRRGKGPGEKTHPQGHPPHAALLSRPQSCLPAPNPAHSADAFQALSPHRKWGGRVLAPLPSLAGVPLELPYPNHRHIRLLAAGLCYYSTSPRGFSTGLTTPFPHGDELRIPTQLIPVSGIQPKSQAGAYRSQNFSNQTAHTLGRVLGILPQGSESRSKDP